MTDLVLGENHVYFVAIVKFYKVEARKGDENVEESTEEAERQTISKFNSRLYISG